MMMKKIFYGFCTIIAILSGLALFWALVMPLFGVKIGPYIVSQDDIIHVVFAGLMIGLFCLGCKIYDKFHQ